MDLDEDDGTDHARNGSREKRGDKSRSDKQRRENIGKVRKGEKEKKETWPSGNWNHWNIS